MPQSTRSLHRPLQRSLLHTLPLTLTLLTLLTPPPLSAQTAIGGLGLDPVPPQQITLLDGFWKSRLHHNAQRTLPALWSEFAERGLFANFALAAKQADGEPTGDPRHDALVYELIEGAAYTLRFSPDEALAARVSSLVATIAAAQQKDGYLNTHVQLTQRGKPWRDLAEGRELYCAARLIDAGLALADATGDRALLEVAIRMADRVFLEFGPDGPRGDPPGHPAIEASLVELGRATGDDRYIELATRFVDLRGSEEREALYGEHAIDDHPLFKTRLAYGEADRLVELQRGVAEVARATAYDEFYKHALTISDDVYRKKTYVTGGIGQTTEFGHRLLFTEGWKLPDDTAACETCTAASCARWHRSLFLLTGHAVYPTLAEEVLHNALPAGIALDGRAFRRDNPLASTSGAPRSPWADPGCCAVAAFRTLADFPAGMFARKGDDLFIAAYAPCKLEIPMGATTAQLTVESDYPRHGKIAIRYDSRWSAKFSIHVLIPAWCERNVPIGVNEIAQEVIVSHGEDPGTYLAFQREWKQGDTLLIELPLEPFRVLPAPEVTANAGRVCIRRGPEVYAFEAIDHGGSLANLWLPDDAQLESVFEPDFLGGVHVVRATGMALVLRDGKTVTEPVRLTAIPYALTQNRGACAFTVWIPNDPARCEPQPP